MPKDTYEKRIRLSALYLGMTSGLCLSPLAIADGTSVSDLATLKSWTFPTKSEPADDFLSGQDAGKIKLVLKLGPQKQWTVAPNADFNNVGVEAIGFNFTERTIYPLYPTEYTVSTRPTRIFANNRHYKAGISPCHDDVDEYGYAKVDLESKRFLGYSPCSSSLTKTYVTTSVSGSLSHALDSLTGSFLQHPARDYVVIVNSEAVNVAVTSANALAIAIQTIKDHEQTEIAGAMTSADLRKVIQRYQSFDLTGQLPNAIQQERGLHTSEYRSDYAAALSSNTAEAWRQFTIRYSSFDPDGHLESAQATYLRLTAEENKQRAVAQNEQQAKIAEELSAWRKTVAVGTHTHCGPVLERRGTLVQVYSPVESYGNEHWIEISDLYPEGNKGCYFSNGHLVKN